jgi:hypothetical protein
MRRIRHRLHRRRNPDRDGAHRRHVRHGTLERGRRHHHCGQEPGRRHASFRRCRPKGDHGLGPSQEASAAPTVAIQYPAPPPWPCSTSSRPKVFWRRPLPWATGCVHGFDANSRINYEIIGDVRGIGPMLALELVADREKKDPATDQPETLVNYCLERGLILLSAASTATWSGSSCP